MRNEELLGGACEETGLSDSQPFTCAVVKELVHQECRYGVREMPRYRILQALHHRCRHVLAGLAFSSFPILDAFEQPRRFVVIRGHALALGKAHADLVGRGRVALHRGGAQAWAAFLFASYLFGHLVFLLGSWLDEFYDWAPRYTLNTEITLLAPNGLGDTGLSQFDDPQNVRVTLLAATSSHLYVGYNNIAGLVLYRSRVGAPSSRTDFEGAAGCDASQAPSSCDGLGGRGLGASATRIFDGRVLTYGGKDYVYLTAGNGSSGFRVFRLVQ